MKEDRWQGKLEHATDDQGADRQVSKGWAAQWGRGKSTLIEYIICKVGPREGGGYIYENYISNSIRMTRSAVYANNGEKSIYV